MQHQPEKYLASNEQTTEQQRPMPKSKISRNSALKQQRSNPRMPTKRFISRNK